VLVRLSVIGALSETLSMKVLGGISYELRASLNFSVTTIVIY